jgi:hypothetical protein
MAEFRMMLGVGLQLPSVAARSARRFAPWTPPTGPTYDADATAYFAAVIQNQGADLTALTKGAINDFVVSLKGGTNPWARISRLVILGNEHSIAARTDLRQPTKIWTASGAPAFEAFKGYTGDRTAAFLTSNDLLTTEPLMSRESVSHFVWVNSVATGTAIYQMGTTTAAYLRLQACSNAGLANVHSTGDGGATGPAGTTTRLGFRAGVRSNATDRQFYFDPATNVEFGTTAANSAVIPALPVTLFRSNTSYGGDRLWTAGYGASLTGDQVLQLYNNLETLRAAMGVPKS